MARIIIPEGLVGYYSLDGNTIDSSGSGNHGTLVNSVGYRQGKFKHGVGFNGSSTYVDIGSRLGTMAPPVTLAAWVYFSSAPSWGSSVFPRVISTLGQSGANWHGYELLIYNSVSVANVTAAYGVLYQAGQGTSAVYTRGSVEGITRPGWYHLAVTATAGTPTVPDIYINGVVNQNQNNFAVGGNKTTVAGLWNARIGGISNYAGADYFARDTMVIDDARIYNRVLSPGEILTLASQRPPPRRVIYFGAGGAGGGNITFTADPYSLAFTGSAASLFAGRKLASNPASLTLSGAVATPKAARKLTATPATLTFTGSNATFLSGKILSASPGTLVFTGSTANLNKSSKLVASPGSLTLSGSTANMFRGKILLADPASFALTGSSAGFVRTRVLPADPGTMQFTGASATLGAPVVVQKARPGSDISAGGWLPSTGSGLYAMLDETSYNDSDYIYSPDNPTTETAEIKFTSITDPGVHTGHTLRFRLAAVGQDTVFDVYLMCGATQIATWQKTVVAGDTTTYTETLTTGEAGNITDYTDLRIKVVAHA
jgi:hypothetical protein